MAETIADKDNPAFQLSVSSTGFINVNMVDSSGDTLKLLRSRENLAGSAGTGSNPTKVFTLTTSNAVDIVEVYISGTLLVETTQYTIDNGAKTVTMVDTNVFDAQIITIFYNV